MNRQARREEKRKRFYRLLAVMQPSQVHLQSTVKPVPKHQVEVKCQLVNEFFWKISESAGMYLGMLTVLMTCAPQIHS